ncbi:MAG TPA: ATP-binding protein [Vicinamibacterales bacterium]|nr:ATP-binding protein [Vicinamibacterales bacterium]
MPPTLLIVDDDRETQAVLAAEARARGFDVLSAASTVEASTAIEDPAVVLALVDLSPGSEAGFEMIRRAKARRPDIEIVVVSATSSVASAIRSYELAAFAFVQKPFALDHLFSTAERALEHRRMNLDNRRLVWEMQTINELGEDLRRSLDPHDLLERALRRLMQALDAHAGSVRLRDPVSGAFEHVLRLGPSEMGAIWTAPEPVIARPSDRVIAARAPVVIPDLQALLPPDVGAGTTIRGVISVPLFVAGDLLGTITLGSRRIGRFEAADERLLTIVTGQIAAAVQNARLHSYARRGKQQWEATFDAISEPIAVFDSHGRLLRGNLALAEHLGISVQDLRRHSCDEVGLCGGEFPYCAVGRALDRQNVRAEITTAAGQIFSVTTFPIADTPDDAAVVQVGKNVTEEIANARRLRQMRDELAATNARLVGALERLETTQAQLIQAEKLSAIGQLVAGVAHELNNPLTSVIGYAQLVEEELLSPCRDDTRGIADVAADVRRIAEESERAARIVRNLLAFARRQTAARVPQDPADIFSRVLALRAYEFRLNAVEVETRIEPDLPPVLVDAGQLQQAILNLVLNAEQAMRGRTPRRLVVAVHRVLDASAVQISLTDSGHGIAEANLRRIFDPFFTTRDVGEGTGLGLSICYGIVRDHGGQISVDSTVGVGTTFRLLLPAYEPRTAEVMVAHKEQSERDYIAAMLGGWGYRVTATDEPDVALARYRAGGLAAIVVDASIPASDPRPWEEARSAALRPVPMVLMAAAVGDVGAPRGAAAALVPPYDLRAVRAVIGQVCPEPEARATNASENEKECV